LSFVPSSGTITKFIVPEIEGIRVDTAMYSGYSILVFYDSLIAKIISFANTPFRDNRKNEELADVI
jgi:acetyl-CoA carboxylase, biotin carboxylase subunit